MEQNNAAFCGVNGIKDKFLILLHIFIICQRKAFHRSQQRHQGTIDTTGLAADKLSDIRIFLLWHNAAAGRVGIINVHKLIFVGIPGNDLLAETGKMHHNNRHII